MMVMVLLPGGGATWAGMATFTAGALSAPPVMMGLLLAVAGRFFRALASGPVETTAVGSPPRGSLTNIVQTTTAMPNRPSAPVNSCGSDRRSFDGRLRLSWPRGAFSSSDDKAQILANHPLSLARDDFHGFAINERGGS